MSKQQNPTQQPSPVDPLNEIQPIDADMPAPETKDYTPTYVLQPLFMMLVNETLGQLPYATVLTNKQNNKIKLIDIIRFIEAKQSGIVINELEEVLTFIGSAPFKYVRPLMEIVDNKERHSELWQPVQ